MLKRTESSIPKGRDCLLSRKEELTGGVWASQEWQVLLTGPVSVKEQNRRVRRRRWREGTLWPLGTEARLTLKHTSRWSSADRWSWTAELKWWPSRRRSSSGSYIPVKGAAALNVSTTQTSVLLSLSPAMPAAHSHCWAAAVQILSIKNITPRSSHQTLPKLWHFDLVFLAFMYSWCHSFQFSK